MISGQKLVAKKSDRLPQVGDGVNERALRRAPLHPLLELQNNIGNQAVLQLLRSGSIQAKLAINQPGGIDEQEVNRVVEQVVASPPAPALQRKCACGGAAGPTGECEECRKKHRLALQTKLKINEPGDIYEQEADRVADQVLAVPAHSLVSEAPPHIQRFSGQPAGQVDTVPASVDPVLAGSGRPLDLALQQEIGQRFGHDFSQVRVHCDAAAEQSAREVDAEAYTVGHHMVFGAGRFAPETHEGRRLIAHELTHVVQQSFPGNNSKSVVMRQPKPVETKFSGCTVNQSKQIDAVVQNAKKVLNTAESVVGTAYGNPSKLSAAHRQLLMDHFHTASHDDLRRILGTYISVGRAFDSGLKFQCETTCQKTATSVVCGFAYNTMWFGGKGPIHICFDTAGCDFSNTAANNQVALVIHEAAHRHAGVDDKVYKWEKSYATLSAKDAMNNADSYAWFAVLV
jgi:Domain of unknown function (DUF4157)/Lysine-specific metallo-endopeptidase